MADTQAYHKFPYYPYYPSDFEAGTAAFTLSEVGAYQRLLNYQWSHGSVPDDLKALSRILRCTPSTAKSVWATVASKFPAGEDGQHRNPRMAHEREEAEALLDRNRLNGARGGRPKKTQTEPRENPVVISGFPKQAQNENPNKRQSEPDPDPEPDPSSKNDDGRGRVRGVSLLMNPLQYAKMLEKHAFVGARLRIPHVLHDELRTKLGGENPESRLQAWYGELDEALERTKEPIPDVFSWLRPKFLEFAQGAIGDAAKAEFLKLVGGANGR